MDRFIQKFENLIRQSLFFKYNAGMKSPHQYLYEYELLHFPVELDFRSNSIIIQSKNNREVNKHVYQIPKTRLKYHYLESGGFSIKSIRFLNHFLFVFINNGNEDINIHFKDKNNLQDFTFLPEKNPCTLKDENLYCIGYNLDVSDSDATIKFIDQAIIEERKIHPLNQFNCSDMETMVSIDKAWINIPYIQRKRVIRDDNPLNCLQDNFLWLQELYIYFGWTKELSEFYKSNDSIIPETAKQRYKSIVEGESGNYEFSLSESFLNQYFNISLSNREKWADIIQEKWEKIQFPIRRQVIKKDIKINSDEWIAFLLITAFGDYWWTQKLFSLVESNINNAYCLDLFRLLFLLKSSGNISYQSGRISVQDSFISPERISVINTDHQIVFKKSKLNKQHNYSLNLQGNNILNIDQRSGFEFDRLNNEIKIVPLIPVIFNVTDIVNVLLELDNYKIQVPLFWDKFALSFNNRRFRFLRKKRKFQITVRYKQENDLIKLNGLSLPGTDDHLTRTHFDITKKPGQIFSMFYNLEGVRIHSISKLGLKVLGEFCAIDEYGLQHKTINFKSSAGPGSILITRGHNQIDEITIPSYDNLYGLSSRNCRPETVRFIQADDFTNRIFYAISSVLMIKLIIYINMKNASLYDSLKAICLRNLGFLPVIQDHNHIEYLPGVIGLIIDIEPPWKIINDYELFSVVRHPKHPNPKYIYISENNIDKMFSDDFFKVYLSKI
ncbi:MAG: hypothetical protein JXB44_01055 [Calditrichaceae bacterium]|nr:hypothetical protein [Calditrichaceae bacterium]RQV97632.1 MAG: hypothetical protein EH224_01020 [Calditrichota bacterium]